LSQPEGFGEEGDKVGRIIMQNGDVIKDVKKVIDTHDGFLRVERYRENKIVIDIMSKEKVDRIEDIKIWGRTIRP